MTTISLFSLYTDTHAQTHTHTHTQACWDSEEYNFPIVVKEGQKDLRLLTEELFLL